MPRRLKLGYRPNVAAQACAPTRRTIAFISDCNGDNALCQWSDPRRAARSRTAPTVVLIARDRRRNRPGSWSGPSGGARPAGRRHHLRRRAREIFVPDMPASTRVVMLNGTNAKYGMTVLPAVQRVARRR